MCNWKRERESEIDSEYNKKCEQREQAENMKRKREICDNRRNCPKYPAYVNFQSCLYVTLSRATDAARLPHLSFVYQHSNDRLVIMRAFALFCCDSDEF